MSTDTGNWPKGYDLIVLDSVDSTMAEAGRRRAGLTAPTWILAHHQTAGRGRRGRTWVDQKGNFSASLVLAADMPPEQLALRSYVAALAVFDTISLFANRERLSLKWPNDVLVDGRKIAGILLESEVSGKNNGWLTIGIGINLATAPPSEELEDGAHRAICLAEVTKHSLDAEKMVRNLAFFFEFHDESFRQIGFYGTRRAWLKQAAKLGEVITARTGTTEFTGTFDTIDEQGQLILSTAKGRQAIPAADVYF